MAAEPVASAIGAGLFEAPVPLLAVEGVAIRFGGIVALDGVSFDVRQRAI